MTDLAENFVESEAADEPATPLRLGTDPGTSEAAEVQLRARELEPFQSTNGEMWYTSKTLLGEGGFGAVYLGMSEQGMMVAIKQLPVAPDKSVPQPLCRARKPAPALFEAVTFFPNPPQRCAPVLPRPQAHCSKLDASLFVQSPFCRLTLERPTTRGPTPLLDQSDHRGKKWEKMKFTIGEI